MTNFQSAGSRVSPTTSMAGAGISRMTGSASAAGTQAAMGGGGTIQVAQMVVREEADVQKVAQALFRIQQDRLRGRGLKA
jgi:predicted N-acetyltransferase YhbS